MTWAPVPDGSEFPIENLPFGVFRLRDDEPRVGVRIGDHVVDLVAAGIELDLTARPSLNPLIASGRGGACAIASANCCWKTSGPTCCTRSTTSRS